MRYVCAIFLLCALGCSNKPMTQAEYQAWSNALSSMGGGQQQTPVRSAAAANPNRCYGIPPPARMGCSTKCQAGVWVETCVPSECPGVTPVAPHGCSYVSCTNGVWDMLCQ